MIRRVNKFTSLCIFDFKLNCIMIKLTIVKNIPDAHLPEIKQRLEKIHYLSVDYDTYGVVKIYLNHPNSDEIGFLNNPVDELSYERFLTKLVDWENLMALDKGIKAYESLATTEKIDGFKIVKDDYYFIFIENDVSNKMDSLNYKMFEDQIANIKSGANFHRIGNGGWWVGYERIA